MSVPFNRKEKVPCRHHAAGKCNRGKACPFAHVDRKEEARNSAMAAVLKLVFEKQNAVLLADNGRMLNLERLAKCPDLEKVTTGVDFDSMAFCEALVSVVRAHCTDVQFISVDDNGIRSLFHLLKALERADMHHGIRAVSAMNNHISTFEFVKQMKPFENLREIRLLGNPVAALPDYRTMVRKGLPQLEGLDGAGVNRPPLNLPWPQPTEQNETTTAMLQQIEQSLFRVLESGGTIDSLSHLYHEDAIFSLTCSDATATVKPPTLGSDVPRRNVIIRDFVAMRMAQTDRDNNIKTVRGVRAAKGRTDVCSALRATLYPRCMNVLHNLSSDSCVTSIEAGVKEPVHVFQFHGTFSWFHKEQPVETSGPVTRIFDRTLVVLTAGDTFAIISDAITIRPDMGEALWFAQQDRRVDVLAAKYNIDPSIVRSIISVSSTDIDVDDAARDLTGIAPEGLQECLDAAGGNDSQAVIVARMATRTGIPPPTAYGILSQHNFDLLAAIASTVQVG
jgi:hypothetical protein